MNYNIAHYFERKRINISDIIYLTRKTPHTVITLMNGESYSTTAMMKWLSSKVCLLPIWSTALSTKSLKTATKNSWSLMPMWHSTARSGSFTTTVLRSIKTWRFTVFSRLRDIVPACWFLRTNLKRLCNSNILTLLSHSLFHSIQHCHLSIWQWYALVFFHHF